LRCRDITACKITAPKSAVHERVFIIIAFKLAIPSVLFIDLFG